MLWLFPVLLFLPPSPRSFPPPKYDPEKLPYRASWGAHTVVVEKTGNDDFSPQRARILDEKGEVVREVRDYPPPLMMMKVTA